MAGTSIRYYGKERCDGMVVKGRRRVLFHCRPDGRVLWEPVRDPVPNDMRELVETHCNVNCRAPRWRRPGAAGLRGCGCGR